MKEKLKYLKKEKSKSSVNLAKFIGYSSNTVVNTMAMKNVDRWLLLKLGFEKICSKDHKEVLSQLEQYKKFNTVRRGTISPEMGAIIAYVVNVGDSELEQRLKEESKEEIVSSYKSRRK